MFGQLDVVGGIDDALLVGNGSAGILRVDATCGFVDEALIDLIVTGQRGSCLVDDLLISVVGTLVFHAAEGVGQFGEGVVGEVGAREVDASAGAARLCAVVVVCIDLVEFGFTPNGAILGSPTTVHFELVAAEVPLSVRCGRSAPIASACGVALGSWAWAIVVADEIDAVVAGIVFGPSVCLDLGLVVFATILVACTAPVEDYVVGKFGIHFIVMFAFCLRW